MLDVQAGTEAEAGAGGKGGDTGAAAARAQLHDYAFA